MTAEPITDQYRRELRAQYRQTFLSALGLRLSPPEPAEPITDQYQRELRARMRLAFLDGLGLRS